jgi:hypothetical protein
MKNAALKLAAVLLSCGLAQVASAQTITGTIVGSVTDPSGLAVVGAKVTITQTTTGVQRTAETSATGDFAFNSVTPGIYNLAVEAAGFKKVERTQMNLPASERLSTGAIALEVGNVTESVTVEAQGAAVQVASAERSGALTSSQMESLMIKGRNVSSLLQLLPGVVDTANPDGPDRNFAIGLYVNGDRRNAIGSWLDGVPTQDSGVGWISTLNPSMDSLAEVKVLLNQYQAEYGRARGAGVQMVTKSGTRDFHGSFSYFKRHEQFNANSFFNNRTIVGGRAIPKARYRYNTFSYTIGGPIYVPGKWNTDKSKAFFFWTQEIWPQKSGVGPTNITVPTELERAGNFSQSVDVGNRPIIVRDPDTQQPLAGNIMPASRLDPNGVALLKFLPLPNFFDRSISGGNYNYVSQVELEKPQRLQTLKLDYNFNSNNMLAVTWSRQVDKQTGTMGLATPNANWPLENRTFQTRGNIVSGRYQKIFSPTLVNELVLGYNWRWENETIPDNELQKITRATVGFNASQLYPNSNPLNLLPNVTWGGIPNTANITLTNVPYEVRYPTYTITDNITKTSGPHIFKAGIFLIRQSTNGISSTNRGTYNFASNANNPFETGYTWANTAFGVFNNVSQANRFVRGGTIFKAYEWFLQDSWKAHRRLTLEIGARFITSPPGYGTTIESAWQRSSWQRAQAPQLIRPTTVGGRRAGIHPVTGEVYSVVAIGAIAPNTGNFANGIVLSTDSGIPRGMVEGPGLMVSPRVGFAWDVFGNGKTAVRGGGGIFQSSGAIGEGRAGSAGRIPLVINGNINFGSLNSLASNQSSLITPSGVTDNENPKGVARSYNANFGIQHNLGWNTVLDASWVGTFGRHLRWAFDLDPIAVGARFDAVNRDPTTNAALPDVFLRSFQGFSGVTNVNYGSSSNYHSLQVMANRRFTKGLQFGLSYTWSKWLNTVDFDDNAVNPFIGARNYHYGFSANDRPNNLRVNFLWDLPNAPFSNIASRWVLNGWQVSGITAFISGAPANVGFTTSNNRDITGTPSIGARIDVTGKVAIDKSERAFQRFFRTDVFRLPATGTLGNGGKYLLRGPGINNWDLSFVKKFPIREPLTLQFRAEFYNAFNHTQFSGINTTAPFDANGNLITTSTFGQITGARTPRIIQLATRFTF